MLWYPLPIISMPLPCARDGKRRYLIWFGNQGWKTFEMVTVECKRSIIVGTLWIWGENLKTSNLGGDWNPFEINELCLRRTYLRFPFHKYFPQKFFLFSSPFTYFLVSIPRIFSEVFMFDYFVFCVILNKFISDIYNKYPFLCGSPLSLILI